MAGTKVKVKSLKGSRPSVPHGTNFQLLTFQVAVFIATEDLFENNIDTLTTPYALDHA